MNKNSAIGSSWDEVRAELFTPEEIAESNLRVALIGELIKARQEKGISQKKLEELSGVKQPIIARMEKGSTSPQIDTLLKVSPAGKDACYSPAPEVKRSYRTRGTLQLIRWGFLFIGNYEKIRNNPLTYSGQSAIIDTVIMIHKKVYTIQYTQ